MISVAVVDDQPLIRTALERMVEQEPGLQLAGSASNGLDAVSLVSRKHPDVVVMDIRMPLMDGIEACRAIRADPSLEGTHVLMLTTFEEEENVMRSIRAGASGFVGKAVDPPELFNAIRTVAAGEALLSPRATRTLIERFLHARTAAPGPDLSVLTLREGEVLELVAQGLSNEEIGAILSISPSTAKTHVNRVMSKLGAHNRAQLVVLAHQDPAAVVRSP